MKRCSECKETKNECEPMTLIKEGFWVCRKCKKKTLKYMDNIIT